VKWSLLGLLAVAALVVSAAQGATIAKPKVLLSPPGGPPTASFSIAGTGFAPGETLAISWDGSAIASETADASGAFAGVQARVPADAPPGNHQVVVAGQSSGRGAQRAFLVRTNWTQPLFASGNTRFNNYENVLSPANVSGLALSWTSRTGGLGQPIVAGGRVYAICLLDGSLHALSAATGAELWTAGGNLLGVPSYGANNVYATGRDGRLYAFDAATGQSRWTAETGGTQLSHYAIFNSGRVYVSASRAADGISRVYAFDAVDGAQLWSAAADSPYEFSVPAAVGTAVYATAEDWGSNDTHVYALDAATGARRWVGPGYYAGVGGDPTVAGHRIYAGSGEGDDTMVFRAANGALVGTRAGAGSITVGNGNGYAINFEGMALLSAWSEPTGSVVWTRGAEDVSESEPFFPAGGGTALANGVLYVSSSSYHRLYALDAATGETLAKIEVGADSFSQPVVADGVVYVSAGGNISAFSLPAAT
jgi:outer membrane protein assembly factor BamB